MLIFFLSFFTLSSLTFAQGAELEKIPAGEASSLLSEKEPIIFNQRGISIKDRIPFESISPKADWIMPTYIKSGNVLLTIREKGGDWNRTTWDPISRKVLSVKRLDNYKDLKSTDFLGLQYISKDGRYLATAKSMQLGGLLVEDLQTNEILINKKGKFKMNRGTGVWLTRDPDDNIFANYIYPSNGNKDSYKNIVETINIHTKEVVSQNDLSGLENRFIYGMRVIPENPLHKRKLVMGFSNFIVIEEAEKGKLLINLKDTNGGSVWRTGDDFFFSPYGKYLIVSSNISKPMMRIYRIYDTSTGELLDESVFSSVKNSQLILIHSTLEMMSISNEDGELIIYDMPNYVKEEVRHVTWLYKCQEKQDSLKQIGTQASPKYSMNSPNDDWIYLGEGGQNGMAEGIGDAVRKDGMRFITNGLFIDGKFVAGKMENVYGVSMEGEFKNMQLNGFGRHITENKAILEGTFVNGKLEGQGESIDPSGLQYVGEFKNGTFEGKGKIKRPDGETFDGEFLAGKPHGNGIYINGNVVEECRYYEGKRIDQAYQMKLQADRMERQQKMAELKEQQKQEYLAQQQKKKSSNKLFGALAMGVGFGIAGSSVGMDAMQSMEFGTAMFQDVLNGGTANLDNYKSNMMAGFEAKKAQYEQVDPAYTQKALENKCNLAEIYDGPDGGQGAAYCAQATLMKCHGKIDRVAQLCKLYKQVTDEPCAVCN